MKKIILPAFLLLIILSCSKKDDPKPKKTAPGPDTSTTQYDNVVPKKVPGKITCYVNGEYFESEEIMIHKSSDDTIHVSGFMYGNDFGIKRVSIYVTSDDLVGKHIFKKGYVEKFCQYLIWSYTYASYTSEYTRESYVDITKYSDSLNATFNVYRMQKDTAGVPGHPNEPTTLTGGIINIKL